MSEDLLRPIAIALALVAVTTGLYALYRPTAHEATCAATIGLVLMQWPPQDGRCDRNDIPKLLVIN